MGAWIETSLLPYVQAYPDVAPYVGAWIETYSACIRVLTYQSHPTWVRGLKHQVQADSLILRTVAPYVGAWIETVIVVRVAGVQLSHPTWVRGLKLVASSIIMVWIVSHPTWVRGLKHLVSEEGILYP